MMIVPRRDFSASMNDLRTDRGSHRNGNPPQCDKGTASAAMMLEKDEGSG
jgi:hypothetical protein